MTIDIANYENVTVLTVKDELAAETVEAFHEKAAQCHSRNRFKLVLDCSLLGGFDSTGLEALLDLQDKCENHLGALKLCSLDETCAKILDITRLSRRFEVYEDLDSAVKSFT